VAISALMLGICFSALEYSYSSSRELVKVNCHNLKEHGSMETIMCSLKNQISLCKSKDLRDTTEVLMNRKGC
jgi:hypothetical protein